MKKTYTTLLAFICFYSATFAQTKGDIELGGDVGLNISTISNGQDNNYNNNTAAHNVGINLGVSADYYFSAKWSIKAKIIYDQKGDDNDYYVDPTNGQTYPTNYRLDYITIPVMANWHFGRTRNWYLNFGPYIGFLTSATATATGSDVKSMLNSTDAGLAFGIGVKIPISDNTKFFAEYQGQAGIANLVTNDQGSSIENENYAINVGIAFNLDRSR